MSNSPGHVATIEPLALDSSINAVERFACAWRIAFHVCNVHSYVQVVAVIAEFVRRILVHCPRFWFGVMRILDSHWSANHSRVSKAMSGRWQFPCWLKLAQTLQPSPTTQPFVPRTAVKRVRLKSCPQLAVKMARFADNFVDCCIVMVRPLCSWGLHVSV